ncbi:MAG TPA: FtsX-like permease family protein, partial [Frankiaceae bacterium]|nr:FtsX-like permease family protein [Frankiaceae bacterium]
MFLTALQGVVAHKLRLLATALAVALGVAFMAGTLVLTDTIGKTFDEVFTDVYKGTDAVVRGKAAFTGPQSSGEQRPRIDAALLGTVARVPGVQVAEGNVWGYARLVGKDGDALGNPATGAPTLGTNWSADQRLNPLRLVAGTPPAADDQVVIDKRSSRDGALAVGDTTTVLVQRGPQRVRIAGIAKFGGADSPAGATVVAFTLPAAQRLVAEPGKYDTISVVAASGVSQRQVVRNLSAALPSGTEAVTGAAVTRESQDQVHKAMTFFDTFLLVFALVALLVGGFMIFNTFSIMVAQRTRENGLLRALGASRRQVLGAVLVEALVVGVVASLIGLGAGLAVAAGLKALLAGVGIDIPTGGVVFTSRTALVALVAGVGITVLAAFSPARKAAKVPPVAAMQEAAAGSTGYGSKERVFVGSGLLAVGVATLSVGLFTHVANRVALVGLGVLLVFFAVSVLGRTVSLPLSRVLGAPLPRLRGVTGDLARENAMRNPKRTAASASALMIGVGLVGFFTIFVASSKASIDATVDRAFTGDVVVDSGGGLLGGVDPSLGKRLAALPEVAATTGVRLGAAKIDGKVKQIAAVDPATAFQIMDVGLLRGSPRDLGRDAIAVQEDEAKAKNLTLGSTVPVVFKDTGERRLRVALVYREKQPVGTHFLGYAAYDANFTNRFDYQVYVKKAGGASTAATLAAVKAVARDYPGTKVLDQAELKAEIAKPLNQMLALVYVLLTLAILIALLGIGNTLALSIFERTRELGVLRAVGMTRS